MADVYDTNIPGMDQILQGQLAAKTAYQNALTRINQQRQQGLRSFGYTASIDPTSGTVADLHVDPNNPFGQYQQMLGAGADARLQARETAVQRGLSQRGGLGAQPLRTVNNQFGAASAQLGSNLSDTLAGFQDQQNQAAYARDAALQQLEQQATQAAILNRLFNPADLSGVSPVDSTGAAPTAPMAPTQNPGLPSGLSSTPQWSNPNWWTNQGEQLGLRSPAAKPVAAKPAAVKQAIKTAMPFYRGRH